MNIFILNTKNIFYSFYNFRTNIYEYFFYHEGKNVYKCIIQEKLSTDSFLKMIKKMKKNLAIIK